jgi:hypothetical protein
MSTPKVCGYSLQRGAVERACPPPDRGPRPAPTSPEGSTIPPSPTPTWLFLGDGLCL